LDYIKRIQDDITDLFTSEPKINRTIEKFNNLKTMKICDVLDINKDHSYYINLTRLKAILENKRIYLKMKQDHENYNEIYQTMEKLSLLTKNSTFFNINLDVLNNPYEYKYIFLPIDNENMVHAFNFGNKKVDKIDIDLGKINLPYFPKYSRSLNVGGKVYVIGGEIFNQLTSVFFEIEFSFLENGQKIKTTVKMLNPMEHGRCGHTIINVDNHKIYAISGAYGEKSCEYYEFIKEKWFQFPPIGEDRIGATLLLKNNEDLYCFFGKRWDIIAKKWMFLESVERVNLYEKFPKWQSLGFRNLIADNMKRRAFAGLITTPNNRVFILGGQIKEEGNTIATNNVVEINVEDLSISPAEITLPKPSTFTDNNFYIFHNNNVQFDVNGNLMFYSAFYKEIWMIENCINSHSL
jgi:hypothetical protein